jgi:hypothetical protein
VHVVFPNRLQHRLQEAEIVRAAGAVEQLLGHVEVHFVRDGEAVFGGEDWFAVGIPAPVEVGAQVGRGDVGERLGLVAGSSRRLWLIAGRRRAGREGERGRSESSW